MLIEINNNKISIFEGILNSFIETFSDNESDLAEHEEEVQLAKDLKQNVERFKGE